MFRTIKSLGNRILYLPAGRFLVSVERATDVVVSTARLVSGSISGSAGNGGGFGGAPELFFTRFCLMVNADDE